MCRHCKNDTESEKTHVSCSLCSRGTRKALTTPVTGPKSGKTYTVCPDCRSGLDKRGM